MSDIQFSNNKNFDNRDFWNKRYLENPALGSGIGSRGENMLHKRDIIKRFLLATKPDSILDVGCGDHESLSEIEIVGHYTGIDISEIITSVNSKKFPGKYFTCADFATISEVENFRSEAVLCLEVLIHQHQYELYHRLMRNLVRAASKAGLVSGYVSDPRSSVQSEIIAWHEPLMETLCRAGARDIKVEGRSLESECLAFVSFAI